MKVDASGLILAAIAFAAVAGMRQFGIFLPPIATIVLVVCLFILKDALSGSSKNGTASNTSAFGRDWEQAGRELGLRPLVRTKKGALSTMRGEIDGHRVRVNCRLGSEPEIEVRFESDLRMIDIGPRRKPIGSGGSTEVVTGDAAFDEAYRVRNRPSVHEGELLSWLTPERREILVVLGDALAVKELEEDELEVRLGRTEWTPNELVQAVQLCVLVAKVLDKSHVSTQDRGPQDAVRPPSASATPQDRVIQDALPPDETGDTA